MKYGRWTSCTISWPMAAASGSSTRSTISTRKGYASTSISRCRQSVSSDRWTRVIEWRGAPKAIRCDNGPEYISAVTLAWAKKRGIRIDFIQPGNPQQNAYVERYNRTVRYDWLAHHLFDSIDEVQDFATNWLWSYNHERPNMAIGGITPKQKLALAA